jgi:hypothetical protein
MAFEAGSDGEVPTHTTVAHYRVDRLGHIPGVSITYSETVEDGLSVFGATAQRQAMSGRSWELRFEANTQQKAQEMGAMLVGIMVKIGRTLLTQLGLSDSVDDATLLTAVTAMDNVDSFISSAFEDLEKARRIGQGPEVWVNGQAPAVHIPE